MDLPVCLVCGDFKLDKIVDITIDKEIQTDITVQEECKLATFSIAMRWVFLLL